MKLSKLAFLCIASINITVCTYAISSPINELELSIENENLIHGDKYKHTKLGTDYPFSYKSIARAKVSGLGECGKFKPSLSVVQNFKTGDLVDIGKRVLKNFTSDPVGMVSSSGMAVLKQANPPVYEWLENGIGLGFDDYLSAFEDCETTQQFLLDKSGVVDKFRNSSINKHLQVSADNSTSLSINTLMKENMNNAGNEGVVGVDGKVYGGKIGNTEQPPLEVVNQLVKAGWCSLTGTKQGACSGVKNISSKKSSSIVTKTFPTLSEASDFATSILGELALKSCKDCNSADGKPPLSISQVIDIQTETIYKKLMEISQRAGEPRFIDSKDLDKLGGDNYKITKSMLATAFSEKQPLQDKMLDNICFEAASSVVIDKIIVLRHILKASSTNSGVVSNEVLRDEVNEKMQSLYQSIEDFQQEIKLRNTLTTETKNILDNRTINKPLSGNVNQISLSK